MSAHLAYVNRTAPGRRRPTFSRSVCATPLAGFSPNHVVKLYPGVLHTCDDVNDFFPLQVASHLLGVMQTPRRQVHLLIGGVQAGYANSKRVPSRYTSLLFPSLSSSLALYGHVCLSLVGLELTEVVSTAFGARLGGFYLYSSLLAVSVLRITTKPDVCTAVQLNLLLALAWLVYFYCDLFPLFIYSQPIQDLSSPSQSTFVHARGLLYAKLTTLTLAVVLIPLATPCTCIHITPLTRTSLRRSRPPPRSPSLFAFLDPVIWIGGLLATSILNSGVRTVADVTEGLIGERRVDGDRKSRDACAWVYFCWERKRRDHRMQTLMEKVERSDTGLNEKWARYMGLGLGLLYLGLQGASGCTGGRSGATSNESLLM
ncbi:hypothetical protein C8R45DRAFT_944846 [Mycena sanguinolenta]|nr:hypothetical protein C8R45DRAFT_944846 [Mycena sanguinolenta]